MKKKLLIVAFVAISAFSFASNEKKTIEKPEEKPERLCGVSVMFFNEVGFPSDYKLYTSDQPTLEKCQEWQNGVIMKLKEDGYRVVIM